MRNHCELTFLPVISEYLENLPEEISFEVEYRLCIIASDGIFKSDYSNGVVVLKVTGEPLRPAKRILSEEENGKKIFGKRYATYGAGIRLVGFRRGIRNGVQQIQICYALDENDPTEKVKYQEVLLPALLGKQKRPPISGYLVGMPCNESEDKNDPGSRPKWKEDTNQSLPVVI